MSGHHHNSNAGTQNQGNSLGDRACVRQSKLYRTHESGNDVKSILGTGHLRWDTENQEGAYRGQKVFDHNKPNSVTNELRERNDSRDRNDLRERANDMKGNINYNYANDWSTESGGSYKNDPGRGQPASSRDPYRNDNQGAMVRPSKYPSNSYAPNEDDYQQQYPVPAARNGRSMSNSASGSSMGGQSLSQYQSESASYQQQVPRQQAHGRVSGNSDGFQAAMNQPERSNEAYQNSRGGGPQRSNSRNNIYGGSEEVTSYHSHPAATQRQQEKQFNAPTGYGQGLQNQQGQYTQHAPQRAGPPQGQYQSHREYDEDQDYQVPGIAAEGLSNREGRSTRPW